MTKSYLTKERETFCVSTQTQAAIIGVRNNKQPPKSLINFVKEKNRWIIDKEWRSTLRKFIEEERIVEWKNLSLTAKSCEKIEDLLKVT